MLVWQVLGALQVGMEARGLIRRESRGGFRRRWTALAGGRAGAPSPGLGLAPSTESQPPEKGRSIRSALTSSCPGQMCAVLAARTSAVTTVAVGGLVLAPVLPMGPTCVPDVTQVPTCHRAPPQAPSVTLGDD